MGKIEFVFRLRHHVADGLLAHEALEASQDRANGAVAGQLGKDFLPVIDQFGVGNGCEELGAEGRFNQKGITARAASDALLKEGQPYESQWPYQNTTAGALALGSPPDTIQVFRRELPLGSTSFDQVCGLLDAGRPVLLGVRISESFYSPNTEGVVGEKSPDPDTGNHAMIAVGHGTTAKGSCVLVRNSWGSTWGLNGHAFVEKGYLENRLILTSVII